MTKLQPLVENIPELVLKPFAIAVMNRLNDACKAWKAASNIDFSLYGTPLESTTR